MVGIIMSVIAILVAIAIVVVFVINNVSVLAPLAERMRERLYEMCEETDVVQINLKTREQGKRFRSVCVYVSGAISGMSTEIVRERFAQGALYASAWYKGARVINPAMLEAQHDVSTWTQAQFMVHWKTVIYTQVSHMVMLPGWEDSKGACMEHSWALELGITIRYMTLLEAEVWMEDEPDAEYAPDEDNGRAALVRLEEEDYYDRSFLESMRYTDEDMYDPQVQEWELLGMDERAYHGGTPHMSCKSNKRGPARNWTAEKAKIARRLPTV